jgi:hypothetical protein
MLLRGTTEASVISGIKLRFSKKKFTLFPLSFEEAVSLWKLTAGGREKRHGGTFLYQKRADLALSR